MKTSSIAQKPEPSRQQRQDALHNVKSVKTVALIGCDGSGKTTIAKLLLETCPLPIKYVYMGTSVESSNFSLPTARLIHRWKVYRHKRALQKSGKTVPQKVTLHGVEHRVDRRGRVGAFVRLCNRVSEESFRQLVSWILQLRGYVVLYDRHFLFDACPTASKSSHLRLTDRIHIWFLRRMYPRPGLAILLDAPADVLYTRKQEVPLEYLESNRAELLAKSEFAKHFVRVDATQPLDDVLETVRGLISEYCVK